MDPFDAIADPTRRKILQLLDGGPMDASQIASQFTLSQPAISKHLKRLLDGNLVSRTVAAQRRVYRSVPDGLDDVAQWVSERRDAWEARLDNLESFLEQQPPVPQQQGTGNEQPSDTGTTDE